MFVALFCAGAPALIYSCASSPQEQAAERKQRAATYMEVKRYAAAVAEYRKAIEKTPSDSEAFFALARALRLLGQEGEYLKNLEKAVSLNPALYQAHIELGQAKLSQGKPDEAASAARLALKADPYNLDAKMLLATSVAAEGKMDEAAELLTDLFSDPTEGEKIYLFAADFYKELGNEAKASEYLEKGMEKFPASLELMISAAQLFTELGKNKPAERLLKEVALLAPTNIYYCKAKAFYLAKNKSKEELFVFIENTLPSFEQNDSDAQKLKIEYARLLLNENAPDMARSILEKAYALTSDRKVGLVLAEVLAQQGKPKTAMEMLSALGSGEKDFEAGRQVAKILLLDGKNTQALQALGDLRAQGDASLDADFLTAKTLAKIGRNAASAKAYKNLMEKAPNHWPALVDYAMLVSLMGDNDKALKIMDNLPQSLKMTRRIQFMLAEIFLKKGDFVNAAATAAGLLDKNPDDEKALLLAGNIERLKKDYPRAMSYYKRAAEKNPASPKPLLSRIDLLEETGASMDKSIRLISEYLKIKGDHPALLNKLAELYLKRQDFDSAEQFINRSSQLDPNSSAAYALWGKILAEAGNIQKAVMKYEEAINLNPQDPGPYNRAAELYKRLGQLQKAKETYKRLLSINPDDAQTNSNLALFYLDENDCGKAFGAAEIAYENAPEDAKASDAMGWVMHSCGRPEEAVYYFEKAIARNSGNHEILMHKALNLKSLNRGAEAEKILSQIARAAPQNISP